LGGIKLTGAILSHAGLWEYVATPLVFDKFPEIFPAFAVQHFPRFCQLVHERRNVKVPHGLALSAQQSRDVGHAKQRVIDLCVEGSRFSARNEVLYYAEADQIISHACVDGVLCFKAMSVVDPA
jgi:hypothetical protein